MAVAKAAARRVAPAVRRGRREVAVVVPLTEAAELTPDERISFRHLETHLGGYDRFALAPEGSPATLPGATMRYLPRRWFGHRQAHSKLLLTPEFYESFSGYRHILIYQMDALVFSDQLREWCARGIDYIGPPWVEDPNPRVGNGGISLRSVDGALRVLRSRRLWKDPAEYWREVHAGRPAPQRLVGAAKTLLKLLPAFNGVRRNIDAEMKAERYFDDFFYSDTAVHYDPTFRVGTLAEGLRFAWDDAPWRCSEMCGGELPFGAHGWYRPANRGFWQPHLLS